MRTNGQPSPFWYAEIQVLRWERDKHKDPKEVDEYNRIIKEVFKEAIQMHQVARTGKMRD